MDRRLQRVVVLAVGGAVVVVGFAVAMFLAWALAGGVGRPEPFDVERQPWTAETVTLPGGAGELQWLRRPADGMGLREERRVRLVPAQGAPTELPLFEVGAPPVSVEVDWLPSSASGRAGEVLLRDRAGALAIDVTRGRIRRLWRGSEGQTWLVDVAAEPSRSPSGDPALGLPVTAGRVTDVTGDWPPADREPLGRLEQDGSSVRWVPVPRGT